MDKNCLSCRVGGEHAVILLIAFIFSFLNMLIRDDTFKIISILLVAGVFIAFTWRRIFKIIIFAIFVAALVAAFPPLAILAFILMIVIFFMRLNYIIKHWRPVLCGFYMYGFAVVSIVSGRMGLIDALIISSLGTLLFHFILLWLYHVGYSLDEALPIMGITPLLMDLMLLKVEKS